MCIMTQVWKRARARYIFEQSYVRASPLFARVPCQQIYAAPRRRTMKGYQAQKNTRTYHPKFPYAKARMSRESVPLKPYIQTALTEKYMYCLWDSALKSAMRGYRRLANIEVYAHEKMSRASARAGAARAYARASDNRIRSLPQEKVQFDRPTFQRHPPACSRPSMDRDGRYKE